MPLKSKRGGGISSDLFLWAPHALTHSRDMWRANSGPSTWVTACHTSRLNMPISALYSHADSRISCFRKHQLKEVSHKRCLNAFFFFLLCKAALTKHTHKHTEGFSVPWGNHLNLWSRLPADESLTSILHLWENAIKKIPIYVSWDEVLNGIG